MTAAREPNPDDCCRVALPAAFPADLAEQARCHKALGDELRLRLLHLVREREVCVCDLVAALAIPQGTLSHHLAVLQQAGLVRSRRQGRWNHYQATEAARRWLAPGLATGRA